MQLGITNTIKVFSVVLITGFIAACGGGNDQGNNSFGGGNGPSNSSATLNWSPPTQNTDGSPLNDLAGYKIYYGTSPDSLTNVITLKDPGLASYVVNKLKSGTTYYFMITAFNNINIESSYSNLTSKIVPG